MNATGEIGLKVKAAGDLRPCGPGGRGWEVIGPRPAFVLRRDFFRRIETGWYRLALDMGSEAPHVLQATWYPTKSPSPRERSRTVRLDRGDDGRLCAVISLEQSTTACRLGLDIEPGTQFRFDAVSLEPCAAPLPPGAPAANPERRFKVLFNIIRLLPEERGAGGAGRLVMALLTYLPDHVDLRVAIAPHSSYLQSRFPRVHFVVAAQDTNEHLDHHLAWCDCYIDPLNGLRPTTIGADIAVISLVLDLQHMRMPWFFSQADLAARDREYTYAINRSNQIVVISDYERDNFIDLYGVDRITVMHLAGFMAEERATLTAARAPDDEVAAPRAPYLIYPAVPWQHKNHATLIQAIAVLKRRGHSIPLVLTNAGGHAAMRAHLADMALAHGVADLVSLEPFLPEEELFTLLTQSVGMVFPSLYEGFGIPLVDAMALGVPLLTTRTSAVPEICGDAAFYFDRPQNAVAMADDIEQFWYDGNSRQAKRELGLPRSLAFSSSKMTDNLLEAIEAAMERRQALPPQSQPRSVNYLPLSVLVIYSGVEQDDRDWLRAQGDLDAWHRDRFGADADITVALDPDLLADPVIAATFGRVPKLILCAGRDLRSLDAAVLDFSNRYDQAEAQLVVRFADDRLRDYDAGRLELALLALGVHQDADYAVFDPRVQDCRTDARLDEVAGVLDYEDRRRTGYAVLDAIIKRQSAAELRNGSSRFLSRFCADLRRLRMPCP